MGFDPVAKGASIFKINGEEVIISGNPKTNGGFVFHNPKANATCGCGTSFSV